MSETVIWTVHAYNSSTMTYICAGTLQHWVDTWWANVSPSNMSVLDRLDLNNLSLQTIEIVQQHRLIF